MAAHTMPSDLHRPHAAQSVSRSHVLPDQVESTTDRLLFARRQLASGVFFKGAVMDLTDKLAEALEALTQVRDALRRADGLGLIAETLWIDQDEALIDRLDLVIAEIEQHQGASKFLLAEARNALAVAGTLLEAAMRFGALPRGIYRSGRRGTILRCANGIEVLLYIDVKVQRLMVVDSEVPV